MHVTTVGLDLATGASRIRLPLPALIGSVDPANGSPVFCHRARACRVVIPMSKQSPVQEYRLRNPWAWLGDKLERWLLHH